MAVVQDKAEEKMRTLEVRAEEQRKAKELEGAEWRRQQHERELARQRVRTLACPLHSCAVFCASPLVADSNAFSSAPTDSGRRLS